MHTRLSLYSTVIDFINIIIIIIIIFFLFFFFIFFYYYYFFYIFFILIIQVLRPVGNIQPLQQQQVFTFDDDVSSSWQRKISATVAPLQSRTPEKENQPLKPLCLTPVLPGTRSITHNITRMLPDTQCENPFQTSTPERTSLPNFGQSAFQPFTSRSFLDINKSSTSYSKSF